MQDDTGAGKDQEKKEEVGPGTSVDRTPQLIGALVGGGVGLILGAGARQLGWVEGSLARYALWGAAIGGLVGAFDALALAGQRLTRREEPWLNVIVALVGMVVILVVLFALSNGASAVLQRMMGN